MLNVVEQKKKFKLDGDFTGYDLNKFTKYFVKVKKNHRANSLSLSYLSINALKRLENIIDDEFTTKLFKASSYRCPFNGFVHKSIIPVAILTDNPIDYIRMYHKTENDKYLPWYTEMACDPEWNKEDVVNAASYLSGIERALIGPGYTEMFYPSDGSTYTTNIGIELENGDVILFALKEWFNK